MTPDVIIVGAGAAGVGAGLELQARGISCLILEAADRVGGRAFTDDRSLPGFWDQGCQWLHCADTSPLMAWADRLGATYERETRTRKSMIWSRGAWASEAEVDAAHQAMDDAFEAVELATEQGNDVAISDVIAKTGPWAGLVRDLVQLESSGDPEQVSASGYSDDEDTLVDWVITSGYGRLIEQMAAGLPIRLGTKVTHVAYRPGGVRVTTDQGSIEAKAVIVTVSTNVLASGAVEIGAGPAKDLLDIVQHVPCGSYEKVAIALRGFPADMGDKLFCWVDPGAGGPPLNFQILGGASPMMIAHMAGSTALDLAKAGADAMVDYATERLIMAFGADTRKRVVGQAVTGWQVNPLTQGAYSYTKPGLAHLRYDMAAADTGAIAFAGEAFCPRWYATAHGAYQSGRDAVEKLAKAGLVG